MNSGNPIRSDYRPDIDGLRAFAVLSVVLFHAFPDLIQGGFVGVDVFFVISGFLITGHIFERLDLGKFSFIDFFQRRICRIFPAVILIMTLSLLFGWFVLLSDEYRQLGQHVAGGSIFIINFLFASEVGYFDAAAESKPLLHLWSLAIEEQFYIVWPLVLWLAWKVRLNLLMLTLVVFAASFLVNISWVTQYPAERFFWPFGRVWELLSGSIVAWIVFQNRKSARVTRTSEQYGTLTFLHCLRFGLQSTAWSNLASITGVLLLLFSTVFINNATVFPSGWALFPVLGAVLVITAGPEAWLNRKLLMNPLAIWFGLISYPLYLWHWPILSYLHILEDGSLHRDNRLVAVGVSIILAWLTYRFIERPIRFGTRSKRIWSMVLAGLMVAVGLAGLIISISDFSKTKHADGVILRKGVEHRIGASDRWYEGKEDWLFLGNSYDRTVEKLKLSRAPKQADVEKLRATMLRLSEVAGSTGTDVGLLIGPNKSTIYPEFLPDQLVPSEDRYVRFFADALAGIPNVTVYDPFESLRAQKAVEGNLYYRTDTHWNSKGAFLSFKGLSEALGLPVPDVSFGLAPSRQGDLIGIAGLDTFPLHDDDNWTPSIHGDYVLDRTQAADLPETETFGAQEVVRNSDPLVEQRVWVVGDSFSIVQRPFINATFQEVHYLGHWSDQLDGLAERLQGASEKPDVILIIRVERAF